MSLKDTLGQLPAFRERKKIPAHKRRSQVVRTVIGGFIFAVGLLAPKYLGFPWQAGVGIAAFGGFTASKQLVTDFLKALPQAVAAIAGALTGKKP